MKRCRITIRQVVSARHTSQNAITEGDFKCILARNCEGTEQLQQREDILYLQEGIERTI